MDDSILITTKKLLGLDDNYTPFDQDIIVFINGAMMVLQQLGVGPLKGFTITDATQTWSDFLPSDIMLDGVKQYIYLYVRLAFDPPASSVVMEAMNKQKAELEWRLREQAEFYPGDGSRPGYYEKDTVYSAVEPESGVQFSIDRLGSMTVETIGEEEIHCQCDCLDDDVPAGTIYGVDGDQSVFVTGRGGR